MSPSHPTLRPWNIALLLGICAGAALAQPVYRIVGPDGKVTFSDRAPSANAATAPSGNTTTSASGANNLPFALQQIATRYPVTLYTSSDCAPCSNARHLLVRRGVPFTERTITSNEDIAALERLSGSTSLPFATIGGQKLDGFSETEWTQYLDAAEYPKQSQLPPAYQRPAATPLVAVKTIEPTRAATRTDTPPPAGGTTAPSRPTPSNPAGIRF